MIASKELLSFPSRTTSIFSRITEKLLENIPSIYLGLVFNSEMETLYYCVIGSSELLSFIRSREETEC